MKKTKLLALASLLLVAGLVGCGGGEGGSTPAASEETSVQSEAPAQSEEAPAQSEEAPQQSEEAPAPSENTPAGSYESTPSLSLSIPEVGTKFTATQPATLGDFTMYVPDTKTNEVKSENKTVIVNGVEKTYDRRINNDAGATTYEFTAAKAGKFVFVARSSSKPVAEERIGTLSTIDGEVVGSATLPGGTFNAEGEEANSPYVAYEIEFGAAGDYSFEIGKYNEAQKAGTHILDMLVFYAE